ncbi:MAG: response regulator transcription factor [Clostridia bacterium]|nr:response regulator transcription factor [Clostridia bacterium]
MRILLVEDEQRLADALEYILKKNKFAVDVAFDGITGQDMAESGIYDLIILDRMLPGKEGVTILRELRAKGIKSAVIFLTARDTIANKVEGLDAGADDYLIKPFSTEELLARIRALGRRSQSSLLGDKIIIGALTLDPLRCEAAYGNETVKLTIKEAQLLELLMRNHGQVLTKEQILDRIWGFDNEVDVNCVEIYIYYLRRKLDPQKCKVRIDTIRGIGYCLNGG